ncbi:MAG: DUF4832 domain-containing protein [Sandaracinaceae bacterium]|nr:DUF4832 domain-containing protein [Sandaracinaceae bacterium]
MITRSPWVVMAVALVACGDPGPVDAGGAPDAGALDAAARDATAGDAGDVDAAVADTVTDTDYAADDDPDLLNPERGIYYWDPNPGDPHTLVAEWLYLGAECDRDLVWAGAGDAATSPVLDAYAARLVEHRAAGRKVVFRPRYDTPSTEGELNRCGVFQASDAARMRAHVDAVAAMLADFVDVIAFVEAGYLGRWGEWNHAGHAASTAPVLVDPDARRAFLAYVAETYRAAGVDRFVEVRRPLFARELVDADPTAHIGLYNDCFMTDASDQGTYSNVESGNPSNFDSSEAAKAWAVAHTASAPFGGETCPTDGRERWRDCDAMVGDASEPGALHMSYLHGGYAEEARPTWEAMGCYDELRRRLGYRFEVVSVEYAPAATVGQPTTIAIQIRNTGWARLHNPRRASVVLRGDERLVVGGAELPGSVEGDDVVTWGPGEVITVRARFAAPAVGTYGLRLWLPDADRPDVIPYAIAIASTRGGAPLRDGATGENDLGLTMTVTP